MGVGDKKRINNLEYIDIAHRSTVEGAENLAKRLTKTGLVIPYIKKVQQSGVGIKPYYQIWITITPKGKSIEHQSRTALMNIIRMEL